jgi:hypothetical protein
VLLGWKTDHLDCQELHEYARCRTDLVSITEPNEKDQKMQIQEEPLVSLLEYTA